MKPLSGLEHRLMSPCIQSGVRPEEEWRSCPAHLTWPSVTRTGTWPPLPQAAPAAPPPGAPASSSPPQGRRAWPAAAGWAPPRVAPARMGHTETVTDWGRAAGRSVDRTAIGMLHVRPAKQSRPDCPGLSRGKDSCLRSKPLMLHTTTWLIEGTAPLDEGCHRHLHAFPRPVVADAVTR